MFRIIFKLTGFIVLTFLVIPIAWVVNLSKSPTKVLGLSHRYFKLLAKVLGVRVRTVGRLDASRPLLLVSNHISYIDIVALSAAAPLCFTPKAEIAKWPIIGLCCKLIGCVFVDRRRSKTKENMAAIHQGLKDGKPLVLFAEGTTGNGKHLLPVRSSYFQLVESFEEPLTIQPILLSYDKVHGLPMDESTRYKIAWVGDEDMVPHAKELLQLGPIDISVMFLPTIDISDCTNRKEIAKRCEEALLDHIK